jgi:hypothetical protein
MAYELRKFRIDRKNLGGFRGSKKLNKLVIDRDQASISLEFFLLNGRNPAVQR